MIKINKQKARKNQVLISQLPEYIRYQYQVYCVEYSTEFQSKFLHVLDKLKDNPDVQFRVWDQFTYYTYHYRVGIENEKKLTGDPQIDSILRYLYHEYELDPEHLKKKRIEEEIEYIDKTLKKTNCKVGVVTCMLNSIGWRRELALHNFDYPTEKYVDMFDIDEETKTKIKEMLRWEFPLDNGNELKQDSL